MNEVINNIKNEISENDVVLYMKGTSPRLNVAFLVERWCFKLPKRFIKT